MPSVGCRHLKRVPGSAGRVFDSVSARWHVYTTSIHAVGADSGSAYTMLFYIDDSGARPELLEHYKNATWPKLFRDHRLLRTGAAQLGGVSGSFEIYSGMSVHGTEKLVRMVTAQVGPAIALMVSACPAAEWDKWKAAFGAMEHGVRFRDAAPARPRGANSSPATAAPPAARAGSGMPSASHAVPNGFRIAGRSGQAGQALTATFTGGRSAKATFQSAFRIASGYFDQPPVMGSAVADPHDQLVEGLFRATWQGAPVRGLMVATIGGGAGYVGMIFDREDQFSRSLPDLSRQMKASLPAQQDNARQPAAAPHPRGRYNLFIRERNRTQPARRAAPPGRTHALLPGVFHPPHGIAVQADLRALGLLHELRGLLLRSPSHV